MASQHDHGLLPLRREFGHTRHGFDRDEVRHYVEHMEGQLRRLISERDSAQGQVNTLSRELENARFELGKLHARVDELNKPPETLEDLDERMQRVARVANERAEDTVNRAQVAAEEHWQHAVEQSRKLRERYTSMLSQLESHAEALQLEHEQALESTKAEVNELTERATARRAQLDEQSERERRAVEQEFDATMTSERNKMDKYIADQHEAAKNQAERRIAEASAEAKRLLDEAKAEASYRLDKATTEAERLSSEAHAESERLTNLHQQARERLRQAEEVLAGGDETLTPLEGEDVTLPEQQDRRPKHLQSTSQTGETA